MHKFLLTTALLSTLFVPSAALAAITTQDNNVCTVPGTTATVVQGVTVCVLLITDPAELAKQIDLTTGKPVQVRKDYDPNCDGKPSGSIYQLKSKNPVDGTIGVVGYKCD